MQKWSFSPQNKKTEASLRRQKGISPHARTLFQKYPISFKNNHFLPKIIVMLIIKNGRFRSEKKDEGSIRKTQGVELKVI